MTQENGKTFEHNGQTYRVDILPVTVLSGTELKMEKSERIKNKAVVTLPEGVSNTDFLLADPDESREFERSLQENLPDGLRLVLMMSSLIGPQIEYVLEEK